MGMHLVPSEIYSPSPLLFLCRDEKALNNGHFSSAAKHSRFPMQKMSDGRYQGGIVQKQ